jgi:hypothetical protein
MIWKGCGRKRSWYNLNYYPSIRLDIIHVFIVYLTTYFSKSSYITLNERISW